MSLEDLNMKINVGLQNAESALSTLGKIETRADQIRDASVAMAIRAGQGFVSLGSSAKRTASNIGEVAHTAVLTSGILSALGAVLEKFGAIGAFVGGRMRILGTAIVHMSHVVHAAKFAFSLLGSGIKVVLSPVLLLAAGLMAVAKVVWAVVRPIVSLGAAVFSVWFFFKGWRYNG